MASAEKIPVLRISDYNTTGLTGSESLTSEESPLSRLTRGKGGSQDDERGGSFGIGSAVGPMASDLCTVIYISIAEDTGESVMGAYTRLATHTLDGESYRAEGHFTRLTREDDFEYVRPAPTIGPFSPRTEPGTDIYVLGYRMADRDPELERVRDAMIDNFMAAIFQGKLIVEGCAPGNDWTLDSSTLRGFTTGRPEAHAFYEALMDPEPAEKEIPHVGKVRLFVNIDDRLEKKLHTITMRTPLMKIDTFRHNSISAKYAAVLICDSHEGNKYLRQLEPPQHHIWDPARDPKYGSSVINQLKKFTREALKERIVTDVGDEVTIDGLSRFLPTEAPIAATRGAPAIPSSEPGTEATDVESATVQGGGGEQHPHVNAPAKKVRVKVQRPATGDGTEDTSRGKETGGAGKRRTKDVGLPGKGAAGDGASRIEGKDLSFRSWSTPAAGGSDAVTTLAVRARQDESGDIQLVGLGPGGDPEPSYVLPISRAVLHEGGKTRDITVSENTLKDVHLKGGQLTRIDVHMPAGERYRLGVA
ncbi:hypothetical protein HRUBRA_02867 [Pseudohaliea rubra DSM 19751]|uniref:Uncharacterized protein n=2 Tax=Pseudohaliea TaxID=1341120 RepID=A0A095VMD7_9GAMM|nr:hypothetical protein HRUBRA_02867 [Pseudohaliea rubra DSM 19751]